MSYETSLQAPVTQNTELLFAMPLGRSTSPAGMRLGVQEMTRVGIRKPEMQRIAELFNCCLMNKKLVGDEVNEFRAKLQNVDYSFDRQK